MSILIRIQAAQDGWSLQGDTLEAGMMFLSGAQAETAALGLAQRYSDAGQPTEIEVFLRDGSLAGRYVSAPVQDKWAEGLRTRRSLPPKYGVGDLQTP